MTLPSKIGVIINFCSNEYAFLRHCIDSVKPFACQILIPVCDHFFDGLPEKRDLLNKIYAENPDVHFIEFPFEKGYSSHYWHNLSRLVGVFFLNEDVEHVLFVDCDEVADSGKFADWLTTGVHREYEAIRLLNYWYFREPHLQAKEWEHSPLLVKKTQLTGSLLMQERERIGIFEQVQGKKMERMPGGDGKPMFHHYSWVRSREQLLRKVASWGHNKDRDWTEQVEEEFSRPFNGKDFVHGYAFIEVSPFVEIDILKQPLENRAPCDFSHVRPLTPSQVHRINLSLTFDIPLCL